MNTGGRNAILLNSKYTKFIGNNYPTPGLCLVGRNTLRVGVINSLKCRIIDGTYKQDFIQRILLQIPKACEVQLI